MFVYGKKSKFIVFMTDGEYDDFRKIPICICDTLEEVIKVTKEFNDVHELLSLGECPESDVWNDLIYEYIPSKDAKFSWEEHTVVSFKED